LVSFLFLSGSALAADSNKAERDNGYYYNRIGGTVDAVDADSAKCVKLTTGTTAIAYAGVGLMGALVGGIASGMDRMVQRQHNIETCMVVRGWRQVYLTGAQVQTLKAAVAKDRVAALQPITGADPVVLGKIGWVWHNDYAEPKAPETRP
jgi:hypothetical protein